MAKPANFRTCPAAVVTAQIGVTTGVESEVWQLIAGTTLYNVFEGVPYPVQQAIMQTRDVEIDAAIRSQLRGYTTRVSS